MEVAILLISVLNLLLTTLLIGVFFSQFTGTNILKTYKKVKTIPAVDDINPEKDGTVSLDQFTPDFNKPLKIRFKKDEDGNPMIQEEEDNG